MFPDPTAKWLPYPSVLDGIKRPPTVLDGGTHDGVLNLIVIECSTAWNLGNRAYRVEVDCEIYAAFDEMIYSISPHGNGSEIYDGGVYVKEAEESALLKHYVNIDPFRRKVRHFLFVGADLCYETLGTREPIISAFSSIKEALAWRLPPLDVDL